MWFCPATQYITNASREHYWYHIYHIIIVLNGFVWILTQINGLTAHQASVMIKGNLWIPLHWPWFSVAAVTLQAFVMWWHEAIKNWLWRYKERLMIVNLQCSEWPITLLRFLSFLFKRENNNYDLKVRTNLTNLMAMKRKVTWKRKKKENKEPTRQKNKTRPA